MTRKEQSGVRDLTFSGWIRENLPDSQDGFMVSDLDFILWNYKTRSLMLLEVKSHKAQLKEWQSRLFKVLDGIVRIGGPAMEPPVRYKGFHVIRFEGTDFSDGRCLFDGSLTSEEELIERLSMEDLTTAE